ncbi:uncharacterized protein [Pagrus major]|uniref:uncharacterized protein isoform X2 n=1 Tax=Pagrus major TaxID=143350 RepID=UPI003CC8613E
MANGHVEIHDPISNHNDLTSGTNCDVNSTSDQDSMADTVELRLMMVYATRRRPSQNVESPTQESPSGPNGDAHSNGPSSAPTPATTEEEGEKEERKRKKGIRRLMRLLPCIKPQTDDKEPAQNTVNTSGVSTRGLVITGDSSEVEVEEKDELEKVAERLTEIASEIPFVRPELESDAPEDEVEKVIGLLLRDEGDRLNETVLRDANIAAELFWNYSFFEKLVRTLLIRMGLINTEPNTLGPQASPKTQIAVTLEATSRLSAVNTLPMSRMLDHGARYLRDHYSSWAQQEGGYEEAFHSDNEDEDEVH